MKAETMACDICGAKIVKDTGIWNRWLITVETAWPEASGSQSRKASYDVCWKCWDDKLFPLLGTEQVNEALK